MSQTNLGTALWQQGRRADGEQGVKLLGAAGAAYRRALEVYTREQHPQHWAALQNNLGTVFLEQGQWAQGAQGVTMLGEEGAA